MKRLNDLPGSHKKLVVKVEYECLTLKLVLYITGCLFLKKKYCRKCTKSHWGIILNN